MRAPIVIAALAGGLAATALLAQATPQPSPQLANGKVLARSAAKAPAGPLDGKALFHEKCAMCHAAGGMGTGLLARRMDAAVAELEKRQDLTPDFVSMAARMGIGNMPSITRGEVSDAQMAAIARYLSKGKAR